MTTDQILHQLIDDRRTALAASWRRQRQSTRRRRRLTLRRGGTATVARPSGAAATSLAHRIAEHGLGPNEAAIAAVVRTARRRHVLRIATDILEDRSLPDVVRERALGRLLTALETPADTDPAALDQAA